MATCTCVCVRVRACACVYVRVRAWLIARGGMGASQASMKIAELEQLMDEHGPLHPELSACRRRHQLACCTCLTGYLAC